MSDLTMIQENKPEKKHSGHCMLGKQQNVVWGYKTSLKCCPTCIHAYKYNQWTQDSGEGGYVQEVGHWYMYKNNNLIKNILKNTMSNTLFQLIIFIVFLWEEPRSSYIIISRFTKLNYLLKDQRKRSGGFPGVLCTFLHLITGQDCTPS